jgi:nitroreductase
MIVKRMDRRTVRSALELAVRAPSVHNSQPWQWQLGDHSVHLHADRERWLPATDPDGRDLIISCGAALHHLQVALAASGIGARVRRIPNPSEPDHLAALELRDRIPTQADLRLAAAIPRRRTDRRRFGPWQIPEVFVEELVDRAAGVGAILRSVTEPELRSYVIAAIRQAEQVQDRTPGYRFETSLWSARRAATDGVPAANLLTRGSISAADPARRFSDGLVGQADTEHDHALLMVLGSATDDLGSQLRAGEALSAVLLHATDLQLATCPLSQPLEVAPIREALRDKVFSGTANPQLILRVGWAMRGAELPPTPRRPLSPQISRLPM